MISLNPRSAPHIPFLQNPILEPLQVGSLSSCWRYSGSASPSLLSQQLSTNQTMLIFPILCVFSPEFFFNLLDLYILNTIIVILIGFQERMEVIHFVYHIALEIPISI